MILAWHYVIRQTFSYIAATLHRQFPVLRAIGKTMERRTENA
jgi:hypothetical protein